MSAATKKTKTPTITVAGTSALVRANGNSEVKELLQDIPSREWQASKRAWSISARHSEALAELITATGATVIDPDGKLSALYVPPANPAPYYFGTKNLPYFEDWEVGQVLRVRIESYQDAPGAMKGAGIVKITPEGNAWLFVVSVRMHTDEHLGKIKLTSEGKGRIATSEEVEAHLSAAEAPVEAPVMEAPAETEEPVEAPSAEAPVVAEAVAPSAEAEVPTEPLAPAEAPSEAPQPTYIFSEMNTLRFPWWEVGSLIQTSTPVLEPSEAKFSHVPIDIEAPGSTWIRIETLRQTKTARFSRSQTPWYFETSCSARLATAAEIEAWEKKRSPKN